MSHDAIDLHALKARISPADVLTAAGHAVGPRGLWPCIWHEERTPSMKIYRHSFAVCFGCGVRGDVFAVAQALHGLTFGAAVRYVAGLAGLTRLPRVTQREVDARRRAASEARAARVRRNRDLLRAADAYRELTRQAGQAAALWRRGDVTATRWLEAIYVRRDALEAWEAAI